MPVDPGLMGLNRLIPIPLEAFVSTVSVQSKKMQMTPCPKRSSLKRPPGSVPVVGGEGGKAKVR